MSKQDFWHLTLTYSYNLAKVKVNLHTKYQGHRSKHHVSQPANSSVTLVSYHTTIIYRPHWRKYANTLYRYIHWHFAGWVTVELLYGTWEHVDKFHSMTMMKVFMKVCEVSMNDNHRVLSFVFHNAVTNLIFSNCKQTGQAASSSYIGAYNYTGSLSLSC